MLLPLLVYPRFKTDLLNLLQVLDAVKFDDAGIRFQYLAWKVRTCTAQIITFTAAASTDQAAVIRADLYLTPGTDRGIDEFPRSPGEVLDIDRIPEQSLKTFVFFDHSEGRTRGLFDLSCMPVTCMAV